jgi:hypothetical protein
MGSTDIRRRNLQEIGRGWRQIVLSRLKIIHEMKKIVQEENQQSMAMRNMAMAKTADKPRYFGQLKNAVTEERKALTEIERELLRMVGEIRKELDEVKQIGQNL